MFWLTFVVNEALSITGAFVASIGIKPGLKAALENFIISGEGVVAAINAGV